VTKHYAYEAVKAKVATDIVKDIGLEGVPTGERISFVVNGGDTWIAWFEHEDDPQDTVLHIETHMPIGDRENVMHFKGRLHQRIRDFKLA